MNFSAEKVDLGGTEIRFFNNVLCCVVLCCVVLCCVVLCCVAFGIILSSKIIKKTKYFRKRGEKCKFLTIFSPVPYISKS